MLTRQDLDLYLRKKNAHDIKILDPLPLPSATDVFRNSSYVASSIMQYWNKKFPSNPYFAPRKQDLFDLSLRQIGKQECGGKPTFWDINDFKKIMRRFPYQCSSYQFASEKDNPTYETRKEKTNHLEDILEKSLSYQIPVLLGVLGPEYFIIVGSFYQGNERFFIYTMPLNPDYKIATAETLYWASNSPVQEDLDYVPEKIFYKQNKTWQHSPLFLFNYPKQFKQEKQPISLRGQLLFIYPPHLTQVVETIIPITHSSDMEVEERSNRKRERDIEAAMADENGMELDEDKSGMGCQRRRYL